jgi:hypothetical protein
MSKKSLPLLFLIVGFQAGLLLQSNSAWSALIAYEYQAAVSSFNTPAGTFLQDNFSIGDAVSGKFTIDDSVVGSFTSTSGFFTQPAGTEFEANIGGTSFEKGSFYRTQATHLAGIYDRLEALTFNPVVTGLAVPSPLRIGSMKFSLADNTGTSLLSTAWPPVIDLSAFGLALLTIESANSNTNLVDSQLMATITSITRSPPIDAVPVPATVWLFGAGLLGLAGFGKRKSSVARKRQS